MEIIKQKFYESPDNLPGGGEEIKPRFVKEDDLLNLGKEELAKVQFDESGKPFIPEKIEKKENTPPEGDKDKKPDDPTPPADQQKKEPDKKAEPTLDEQIKVIEDIPKDDRTSEQKTELRRLNAERKMHEATQEAAKLRKELEEKEKETFELKSKTLPEFKELDPEEEKELKDTDPDEYNEYTKEKESYKSQVQEMMLSSARKTFSNFVDFYANQFGKSGLSQDEIKKSEDFQNYLKSDEFKSISMITDRLPERDGSISLKTIQDAYFIVNREKIVADAQLSGRQQALEDINKTKRSDASELDRVPRESAQKGIKKLSELTTQEIEEMTPHQRKSYMDEWRAERVN